MSSASVTSTSTRRGRPPQISGEDIIAAVSSALDTDWTVASIAAELGVSDAAIYRYFPSKKAILAAVAIQFYANVPASEPGADWRTQLTAMAHHWYWLIVHHPSFLDLEGWMGDEVDGAYEAVDRVLATLINAGFEPIDATILLGTAAAVSREFGRTTVLANRTHSVPTDVSWDTERFPTLSRASASLPDVNEAMFERSLSMVMDGAAQKLPKKGRR